MPAGPPLLLLAAELDGTLERVLGRLLRPNDLGFHGPGEIEGAANAATNCLAAAAAFAAAAGHVAEPRALASWARGAAMAVGRLPALGSATADGGLRNACLTLQVPDPAPCKQG